MTKKEIMNILEKRYMHNRCLMYMEMDYHNLDRASYYSVISHEIAEIIAEINKTNVVEEIERLDNIFKLYTKEELWEVLKTDLIAKRK